MDTFNNLSESNSQLRVVTCGNVDDGKSTLIGRLLYDGKFIDTKAINYKKNKVNYALLIDGLKDEQKQGITIDVAYRYINIDGRRYVIADTPGHNQFTRNMATGASNSDVSLILIDVTRDIGPQTYKHMLIGKIFGIEHFIFVINKMDLVDYSESFFRRFESELLNNNHKLNPDNLHIIPASALRGDNILTKSKSLKWYKGKSILEQLKSITIQPNVNKSFRMPVQLVTKSPNIHQHVLGRIASGLIKINDMVKSQQSQQSSKITKIFIGNQEVDSATSGQSVGLILDNKFKTYRSDVLELFENQTHYTNKFQAYILWFIDSQLQTNSIFLLKIAYKITECKINTIEYKIGAHLDDKIKTNIIKQNDIAVCTITTESKINFDLDKYNHAMSRFILIEPETMMTVAAGVINDIFDK